MKDLITGSHSIFHAINNPARSNKLLYCTDKGKADLQKLYGNLDVEIKVLSGNEFQNTAQKFHKDLGFDFKRIPSAAFLISDQLEYKGNAWLYEQCEKVENIKLIALDQVTDIQNAGAIMRTAAFYGVDAVIVSSKRSFSLTPGFFRTCSGAYEHVTFVQTSNLSKTLKKLNELAVQTVGLSEEAKENTVGIANKICFVFGAEQTGISHAVERSLNHNIALKPKGNIQSLNVSNAVSIVLERFCK